MLRQIHIEKEIVKKINLNEKLLNKLHPKEIDNYKVFPGSHKEEKDLMELFGDEGRTERQKYNLRRKIINKRKSK